LIQRLLAGAFDQCVDIASVAFGPESSLMILLGFSFCPLLATVKLPARLRTISYITFRGCPRLQTIFFPTHSFTKELNGIVDCGIVSLRVPASVESITGVCGCFSLISIDFSPLGSLRIISGFSGCARLEAITIPSTVGSLSGSSFGDCPRLERVSFAAPSRLHTINYFKRRGLVSVRLPSYLREVREKGFEDCHMLKSVTLNVRLEILDGFEGCSALISVVIPNSVTTIGSTAFGKCAELSNVTFEQGSRAKRIDGFPRCYELMEFICPPSLVVIGESAFVECESLDDVKLGWVKEVHRFQ
jgi:hypothetical protein